MHFLFDKIPSRVEICENLGDYSWRSPRTSLPKLPAAISRNSLVLFLGYRRQSEQNQANWFILQDGQSQGQFPELSKGLWSVAPELKGTT